MKRKVSAAVTPPSDAVVGFGETLFCLHCKRFRLCEQHTERSRVLLFLCVFFAFNQQPSPPQRGEKKSITIIT